jgi:hypothetical protein
MYIVNLPIYVYVGAVWKYTKSTASNVWTRTAVLYAPTLTISELFGTSVTSSKNYLAIGAGGSGVNLRGEACMYACMHVCMYAYVHTYVSHIHIFGVI